MRLLRTVRTVIKVNYSYQRKSVLVSTNGRSLSVHTLQKGILLAVPGISHEVSSMDSIQCDEGELGRKAVEAAEQALTHFRGGKGGQEESNDIIEEELEEEPKEKEKEATEDHSTAVSTPPPFGSSSQDLINLQQEKSSEPQTRTDRAGLIFPGMEPPLNWQHYLLFLCFSSGPRSPHFTDKV